MTSKRAIQTTAETTGDLIGYKIVNEVTKLYDGKITRVSKILSKVFQRQLQMIMIKKHLKKDIYLQEKRQEIIGELRLK